MSTRFLIVVFLFHRNRLICPFVRTWNLKSFFASPRTHSGGHSNFFFFNLPLFVPWERNFCRLICCIWSSSSVFKLLACLLWTGSQCGKSQGLKRQYTSILDMYARGFGESRDDIEIHKQPSQSSRKKKKKSESESYTVPSLRPRRKVARLLRGGGNWFVTPQRTRSPRELGVGRASVRS